MATDDKSSFLKRLIKFLLIAVILLVALVALAPMLFSGFIRDKIIDQANERLDGRLEVADFSFGWMSGVEMSGMKLVRTGQTDAALEVAEAKASPDILAALSGRFLIEDVDLQGVTLRVRRDENGVDWQDVMKSPPTKGKGKGTGKGTGEGGADAGLPEFRLAGQVRDIRVIYDDVALGAPIDLDGLQVTFSASRDDAAKVELRGPEGLAADVEASLFRDGKVLDPDEIRAEGKLSLPRAELLSFAKGLESLVRIKSGRLAIEQDFVWAASALDLKGRVGIDGLDADQDGLRVGLGVGEIKNDLTYGEGGLGGQFDLQLGRVSVNGLPRQVAVLDLQEVVFKLAMPSSDQVRVEAGRIQMPAGRVDVSGELRSGGSGGLALKGDVDLEPLAALFEGLPGLAGKLKLNGNMTRDGDLMRLRGQHVVTGLTARDLAPGAPTIRNETMTLGHDVTMSDGVYDLSRVDLDSSFAKLRLEGLRYRADDQRVENIGKKDSPLVGSLDLDRLSALLGDLMPMDFAGRADLAARVERTKDLESAVVDLVIDSLVIGGGPFGEESLRPGKTRVAFTLADVSLGADSPMQLTASSSLFDLRGGTAMTTKPTAAFGRTGQISLTGSARLDQLLRPFFEADHLGKTDLDLNLDLVDAGFDLKGLRVKDRAVALEATGKLRRSGGRENLDLNLAKGHYLAASGARIDFSKALLALQRGLEDDSVSIGLDVGRIATKSSAPGSVLRDAGALTFRAAGSLDAVNNAADLTISELKAAGADLRGSVDWSETAGLKKLRLDGQLDWSDLATRFISLVDPDARGKGTGPVAIDLNSADGSLERTSGRIDLTIPSLFVEGFDLSEFELKASMTEGKGKIEKGDARLNGGTVKLGGDIDLTREEPQFGSRFEAKSVRLATEWQPAIARVIPIFAGVGVGFSGMIDTDVDLRGQGATWDAISKVLNGSGNLSLREGRVESSPILDAFGLALGFNPDLAINDLVTAFEVKDGGVYQEGLEIKTGVIDMKFGGTTYLDGRLDYKLGLKPVSQKPARWQQFTSLLASDGYLPLGLGGTVSSPSPKLPNPGDMLQRGAEDAIRKGLGDILKPKEGAAGDAEEKPKNPVGGLIDLFGGKKDKKKDGKKE